MAATACAIAVVLAACGDDAGAREHEDGSPFSVRDAGQPADSTGDGGGAGAAAPDPCADQRAGMSCGNRRHCIDGRCLPNACGDGIKAGLEECDDGNAVADDGCDPLCVGEVEACGNGRLDPGEECDDGDGREADGCSGACASTPYCGDGRVDPDEECDDGNGGDDDECTNGCLTVACGDGRREGEEECDDGNEADDDDCARDCTAHVCGNLRVEPGEECDGEPYCTSECRRSGEDPCRACEEVYCRNYLEFGFDLVAGCYDGMPPPDVLSLDPGPSDVFAEQCVAVTDCVRRHRCALGDEAAAGCYCGSASAEQCVPRGPAADAPCVEEWLDAARTDLHDEAVQRLSDWNYPSGLATFLIECDRASCRSECLGAPAP